VQGATTCLVQHVDSGMYHFSLELEANVSREQHTPYSFHYCAVLSLRIAILLRRVWTCQLLGNIVVFKKLSKSFASELPSPIGVQCVHRFPCFRL
jgi:hypothetical protein